MCVIYINRCYKTVSCLFKVVYLNSTNEGFWSHNYNFNFKKCLYDREGDMEEIGIILCNIKPDENHICTLLYMFEKRDICKYSIT